ncbi:hypothetical protein C0W44_05230 [Photobacterium leiognathi subsp. mandapamensis]|nr:hypothetical protein C0W44_05230 [Photobacterium leiognathi subsp. mandapamensis]
MLKKINNIIFGFISSVMGNFLLLILTIFITRTISVEAYGQAKYILNVASIALVICMMGRENIIVLSYQREGRGVLFEEIFITILLLFICFFIIAFGFSLFDSSYINYLGLLMIPLWGAFNITNAALRAINRINESFFISNVIQRVLRFVIVITSVIIFPDAFGVLLGYIISQFVLVIVSIYTVKSDLVSYKKNISVKRYANKFNESLLFGLTALTSVLLIHLDSLMLGQLSTIDNVGLYDIAYSLSIFTFYPLLALAKTTETRALEMDKADIFSAYHKNINISVLLSVIISIVFIIYGKTILSIFGNEYKTIYYAMIVLTCGFTFITAFGVSSEYLLWNKKRKLVVCVSFLAIILNVILNIFLIPLIGGEGAAISSISCLLFSKFICNYMVTKEFNINLKISNIKIMIYAIIFSISFFITNYISNIEYNFYEEFLIKLTLMAVIIIFIVLVNFDFVRKLIDEYKK